MTTYDYFYAVRRLNVCIGLVRQGLMQSLEALS